MKTKASPYTNLDKIYWPQEGFTKGDVLEYYQKIAPWILPYLKNRPLSMRRNPHGITGESFFQKDYPQETPSFLHKVPVQHSQETLHYLMVQNVKSLLFVANLGCIELNPFNSRQKTLENPDYLVIDLDPVEIDFEKVIEAALTVHRLLEQAHIPNYCKTSGGRGLHIYIPMGAKYSYEQVKQFAEIIAHLAHEQTSSFTSLIRSPAKRKHKIYYDYLQNHFGQTLACPYCLRPKPGAPVSTPLHWEEVKKGLDPLQFNLKSIFTRLEQEGDLFKPVLGKGVNLEKALASLEKSK